MSAKYWFQNSLLHRIDGPAVEWPDGYKEWWQNGKLHRIDGPAIEWNDGTKEWYQNNRLHRLDGPAVEYENGTKCWYINGEYIKSCFPKTLTIQEDGVDKQVSICCIECAKLEGISEDKFHKLMLLI